MINRIAFCGYSGSGKTTAANHLVEEHGYVRLSFAAPIKSLSLSAYGCCPRNRLLDIGALLRSYDPLILIAAMDRTISYLVDRKAPGVVVDDCRLRAEYDFLKLRGFTVVQVTRQISQSPEQLEREHKGFKFDATITNRSADLTDLYNQVHSILVGEK